METRTCKGADCGAQIVLAKSITTGKFVPLDARAHPIYRTWYDPETQEQVCEPVMVGRDDADPELFLRVTHFATCPNAADFSRRGGSDGT